MLQDSVLINLPNRGTKYATNSGSIVTKSNVKSDYNIQYWVIKIATKLRQA